VYPLGEAPKRVGRHREPDNLQQLVEHHCPSGGSEAESLPREWLSRFEEGPFSGEESNCEEALLSHSSSSSIRRVIWLVQLLGG